MGVPVLSSLFTKSTILRRTSCETLVTLDLASSPPRLQRHDYRPLQRPCLSATQPPPLRSKERSTVKMLGTSIPRPV